jgi:cation diffusion facilitator family transporter
MRDYISHDFGNHAVYRQEKKIKWVIFITLMTMVAEISTGAWAGSMALLADGVHMGVHALALGLASFAYYFTRKYATDRSFSWGSGKINGLIAYTNAIFLVITVLLIVYESLGRLIHPALMHYQEATLVAVLGLLVNVISVFIFMHDSSASNISANMADMTADYHEHDHNFKAVISHVLADALTSVGAIVGITAAYFFGWNWLDPVIGLFASLLILKWCWNLLKQSSSLLLDKEADFSVRQQVIDALKKVNPGVKIIDLHIWCVGLDSWVVVALLHSSANYSSEDYRLAVEKIKGMHHPIVELQLS